MRGLLMLKKLITLDKAFDCKTIAKDWRELPLFIFNLSFFFSIPRTRLVFTDTATVWGNTERARCARQQRSRDHSIRAWSSEAGILKCLFKHFILIYSWRYIKCL